MNKFLSKILAIVTVCVSLSSCRGTRDVQIVPTTKTASTPTILFTTKPLVTSTIPEQVDSHSLCKNSSDILEVVTSPNGNWIAAECYDEDGSGNSPLQVVSKDYSKNWKIYFRDYANEEIEYGRKNIIVPYRWSKDGNFLYVVSPTIASGCCWIGGKYVLLVRLNLETGEQIELPDEEGVGSSFTISENERFLLFTPNSDQPFDFAILDFLSNETRVVKLNSPEYINLEFAVLSPYEEIIVLPFFKNIEFNEYVTSSLALIDLSKNEQRVLVSSLNEGEELYPFYWIDKEHVLIGNANSFDSSTDYWSLNIFTSERKIIDNP